MESVACVWVLLPPQGALPPPVAHGTRGVGLQLRSGMWTRMVPLQSSKGLREGSVLFESHRLFESTLSDFDSQSALHLRVESPPLGPCFLPTQEERSSHLVPLTERLSDDSDTDSLGIQLNR